MTRKDGLLALLVVVVWGLNFVVIKLGLHNMPPLMLAGLRFMLVAFPALLFVARPAIPLRLLLGYGLTISFGQFAFLFCAIGLGMPAGLASLVLQAQAFFTIILGAFVFGERLQGKQLAGIALGDLWRAGAGGGQPWRGACAAGGLYADPRGGAQLGLRQYFQQENHVPGEPAANHVAGGLERADPGAAVYAGLIVDRWPADHAGESATHRSANDTVAALSGVYRHYRRLWHLGIAAGAV